MKTENRTAPRTFQINIRLSETEYANLSRVAALHGLGRAAYVRMLMHQAWREVPPPKADQFFSFGKVKAGLLCRPAFASIAFGYPNALVKGIHPLKSPNRKEESYAKS